MDEITTWWWKNGQSVNVGNLLDKHLRLGYVKNSNITDGSALKQNKSTRNTQSIFASFSMFFRKLERFALQDAFDNKQNQSESTSYVALWGQESDMMDNKSAQRKMRIRASEALDQQMF